MGGMDESSKPLTRCPVCRYDLRGLPEEHRCPECGLGIDDSMKTWGMTKPSRVVVASLVLNFFVLPFSISILLRGGGVGRHFVATVAVLCLGTLVAGAYWTRRRAGAVLSRTSYATKGRFSWGFEVFQLAELDVVSELPLMVKRAADIESEEDGRNVPLPTPWMSPRQAGEFCDKFVDRWRECRSASGEASKAGTDAGPP